MRLRDRIGIPVRRQRQLTRFMEIVLLALLVVGVLRANTGIIVNAALALAVARLPSVLERDYGVAMDTALSLWLTAAVFLHAVGTIELPFVASSAYQSIWWYDHLTHALSSSVVAAAGYTVVRAVELHSSAVSLSSRFRFAFLLIVTLAAGVAWEVLEFTLSALSALLGTGNVLTQYGLGDTMLDLVFDAVGAVIVAVWGTAHLSGLVGALSARLDTRTERSE